MASITYAEKSSSRVCIVVQPPERVGAGTWLVPPLVARTDSPRILEIFRDRPVDIFATLMLTGSNGVDATGSNIDGNRSASGQLLESQPPGSQNKTGDGSSSSGSSSQAPRQWIYFIFSGLSIKKAGVYTFTVGVSDMNRQADEVETLSIEKSREVNVVDEQVPPGRPSTGEQEILDELKKKDLYSP
ncbi:hypothetical protein KVR01_004833 [Diaporthe batatas]|uniref:uncharacterized protein n=1 Tax=Diaporthe batatas TaxID=748121 RepID=UPI001D055D6E|nr:uncharacterized protein KVR01_004833 [Diaporthe batatas]KAG8166281.1 hypothetical protein KVR01_004833 [Diaporthe batatas]